MNDRRFDFRSGLSDLRFPDLESKYRIRLTDLFSLAWYISDPDFKKTKRPRWVALDPLKEKPTIDGKP